MDKTLDKMLLVILTENGRKDFLKFSVQNLHGFTRFPGDSTVFVHYTIDNETSKCIRDAIIIIIIILLFI